jgi:hypothetical protein
MTSVTFTLQAPGRSPPSHGAAGLPAGPAARLAGSRPGYPGVPAPNGRPADREIPRAGRSRPVCAGQRDVPTIPVAIESMTFR